MTNQRPTERSAAQRARVIATRKKLSGREIARRLNLSPVYVSRRLSGEVEFSETDLRSFASVLGVTAALLLGEGQQ